MRVLSSTWKERPLWKVSQNMRKTEEPQHVDFGVYICTTQNVKNTIEETKEKTKKEERRKKKKAEETTKQNKTNKKKKTKKNKTTTTQRSQTFALSSLPSATESPQQSSPAVA